MFAFFQSRKKVILNTSNFDIYFGLHYSISINDDIKLQMYAKDSFTCDDLKVDLIYLNKQYIFEINQNNKIKSSNAHKCGDDCFKCSVYTINSLEGYIVITK